MSRQQDLQWFERHRQELAARYPSQWLIVHGEEVRGNFGSEEEAVVTAVNQYGVNVASVFQAIEEDPVLFAGVGGERAWHDCSSR